MKHHLAIEVDENAAFPKLEYQLVAPSGRIVTSFTNIDNATTQRDKMRANGALVRLVEVTTITITREID